MINLSSLGAAVRSARESASPPLRQKAVAHEAGVSQSYLSQIEWGDARPNSEDFLRKLAGALGLSPNVLLGAVGLIPAETRQLIRRSTPEKVDAAYEAFIRALTN